MDMEMISAENVSTPAGIRESDFIGLNVDGVLYKTCRSTLTRYPQSRLAAMFTCQGPSASQAQDEHGNFVIDGDGRMFRHVLTYLRRGALCLPDDFTEFKLLRKDAEFYELGTLCEEIDIKHHERLATEVERTSTSSPPSNDHRYYAKVVELWAHREEGSISTFWRVYGNFKLLKNVPSLEFFMDRYKTGSQAMLFYAIDGMDDDDKFDLAKTGLLDELRTLGFTLHTTDCVRPWLRYVLTKL